MRTLLCFVIGTVVFAQTSVFPLSEIRPGQKGVGHTVFSGDRVETFEVEILGVLENAGPRQNVILAKLSGGPLASTGVIQGMSGSPVYIDGKLVGAIALGFPTSKEPIAGIRPFDEMRTPGSPDRSIAECLKETCTPRRQADRMEPIATPLSFTGFTQGAVEHFASRFRGIGLEPKQGVTSGGTTSAEMGNPAKVAPGSMISVQLMTGDMTVGAEGTVTAVEGKRIYAFGHKFISLGDVELPFARAEVITVVPSWNSSFKVSASRESMGAITSDDSVAVRGELGRSVHMVPLAIDIGKLRYRMRMAHDSVITPYLLQMALYSALDASERTAGSVSYAVHQSIEFEDGSKVDWRNTYSGEFQTAVLAAQSGAIAVNYAMQSRLLKLKQVTFNVDAQPQRRQRTLEDVWISHKQIRPGETLDMGLVLAGDGIRETKRLSYLIPPAAEPGMLQLTVADAGIVNLMEYRIPAPPASATDLLNLLNGIRSNTKAYVRIWRAKPSYKAEGRDLPDPPPSIAGLLNRSQGTPMPNLSAKVAELSADLGDLMFTGSKTLTVEVKP